MLHVTLFLIHQQKFHTKQQHYLNHFKILLSPLPERPGQDGSTKSFRHKNHKITMPHFTHSQTNR